VIPTQLKLSWGVDVELLAGRAKSKMHLAR
jgi:hypothetical protein